MRAALGSLGVLCLLLLTSSIRAAEPVSHSTKLTLTASSYPEALPNDGRAESTITIIATNADGSPAADLQLQATVSGGGGMLRERTLVTDSAGQATCQFRMGVAPRPAIITVTEAASGSRTELTIPLAAVSYLDLLLVTPEEYAAHKRRQASAAPIYKLALDAFPQQLAADGGSSSHITATLTFTSDGRPAPGVPLKAEVSGSSSRVSTTQQATDASGRMSFYFTAGRAPGTATVRVLEPSTGLTASASILLVEAGPARIELLVDDTAALGTDHDGTLLPADGAATLPLKIKVMDLYGSALPGVEVRLEVLDLGTGWVEMRQPVSDAFGEISAVYHAGALTGKLRLRAFVCAGLPEV